MTCLTNGAPDAPAVTMLVEARHPGVQSGAANAAVGQVEVLEAVLEAQTGERIEVGIAVPAAGRIARVRGEARC